MLGAGLSLAVWAFQPWSDKLLTWVVASAMRRVMVVSSWCSSNGSGGPGLGPHRRGSSRWEGPDWCSTSNRIFTTSRRAGASRNPVRAPVREDGRARMVSGSCFRARAGSAASWFSACPAGTGRILAPCHSAGHSCTVLSVRSTIFAMMLVLTPSEAYRIASVFIPASTRLPERFLHPTRTAVSFRGDPDPHAPTASETAQETHETRFRLMLAIVRAGIAESFEWVSRSKKLRF
ncbi:hypothetical protein EGX94_02785 [Propionibacterium acidifaciens]|nr:hypothetical protein EGX94_02785 [Propionibacterium acidifaciens]